MENNHTLRVLSVCTSDVAGGAARAAYRIHTGVRERQIDSRMFVKQRGAKDPTVHELSEYIPHNVIYKVCDWVAGKLKNQYQHYLWRRYPNRDANYKSDLRSTCVFGAFSAFDYDIIHLHWINQRFIPISILSKLHKPIVWTLHDSWPFCGVCHYFLECEGYQQQCGCCPQLESHDVHDLSHKVWKKKKQIYNQLDLHIVSPSQWLADCAQKSSLLSDVDIRVIPNCIDTAIYRPLAEEETISNLSAAQKQNTAVSRILRAAGEKAEKPFVLYGAVNAATDRIKGFSSLLSALEFLDKQGYRANLVVFGANETDLSLCFENIDVIFAGYISDRDILVALYNLADVMVVPSLTENLSCTIMESLSCGTPVCCFNIGGNSDMVEHGKNGYLAAETDCAGLATGIRECIVHSTEWGAAARESVLRKYTTEIVAKQYIELYEEITQYSKRG